jgi:hypothetical protein
MSKTLEILRLVHLIIPRQGGENYGMSRMTSYPLWMRFNKVYLHLERSVAWFRAVVLQIWSTSIANDQPLALEGHRKINPHRCHGNIAGVQVLLLSSIIIQQSHESRTRWSGEFPAFSQWNISACNLSRDESSFSTMRYYGTIVRWGCEMGSNVPARQRQAYI